jgi:hypothetical protein
MTDFNIGPGVRAAIESDGGEARSDERFVILTEGDKVSMTMATTGVYYWFERDNQTQRTSF